jgi:mono/diheme cytochrome c family protein
VSLGAWANIKDQAVRRAAMKLAGSMTWRGRSGAVPAKAVLGARDRKRFETGRQEYSLCATCHLPTGQGMIGLAPPLSESRWLSGPPEVLARIVLRGKKEHPDFPEMPSFSNLDDERIATILTYIRGEWGRADPVSAELVARVRQETRDQIGPVTKEHLQRFSGP